MTKDKGKMMKDRLFFQDNQEHPKKVSIIKAALA